MGFAAFIGVLHYLDDKSSADYAAEHNAVLGYDWSFLIDGFFTRLAGWP